MRYRMGRTVPTYHQRLSREWARFSQFRRALMKEEREAFDSLVLQTYRLVRAGSMCTRCETFDAMVLSVMISQEMRLKRLEELLRRSMSVDTRSSP
ncbi:MAG: hypothetical protein NZ920_03115 [Aigarchaeota archaeon]|nr:hypothetical protein [Aigarchaeota archaeon]MDW8092386.1 hypothetical protein [Nitrososphaerota archaeon]